jgi:ketosteroid isomerase-like protein
MSAADPTTEIIALERAALDRWGAGDPTGYLELFAQDVTYFDPAQERRVDGLDAMIAMLTPFTGRIRVDRYDMLSPVVQHHGDVGVLSFNLLSYRTGPDGIERVIARWNSTEAYRRTDAGWRIFHNHWSFIKPELKDYVSEEA